MKWCVAVSLASPPFHPMSPYTAAWATQQRSAHRSGYSPCLPSKCRSPLLHSAMLVRHAVLSSIQLQRRPQRVGRRERDKHETDGASVPRRLEWCMVDLARPRAPAPRTLSRAAQFDQASSFNGDISGWNVEEVTKMERMVRRSASAQPTTPPPRHHPAFHRLRTSCRNQHRTACATCAKLPAL